MKTETAARQLRRDLDEKLSKMKKAAVPPARGWIHNVREALGMSTHQLARRLEMSQSGIVMIEQSEARGAIQLSTLKKVAEALDCDLVYALAPKAKNFDALLERQRYSVAEMGLLEILHKSSLTAAERRELISAYAQKIKPKRVWEPFQFTSLVRRVKKGELVLKGKKSKSGYVRGDEFHTAPRSASREE